MDEQRPKERRSVPRLPAITFGPIQLTAQEAELSLRATARDISIQGIGIVAERELGPGTHVSIRPTTAGKRLAAELTAEVRHKRKLANGHWLLGCSLSRYLTTEDVLSLG